MEIIEKIDSWKNDLPETFENMNLNDKLLCGIHNLGFTHPTPVQQKSIIPVIKGRNAIINTRPQTGKKTSSFIAALENVNPHLLECQVLVIPSDTETAMRTTAAISKIGGRMNIRCYTVGVSNAPKDISEMKNGVHVIVGTFDSIFKLIRLKIINTIKIKICILENPSATIAKTLINKLNSDIQILLLFTLLKQHSLEPFVSLLKNPLFVMFNEEVSILENTRQCYVSVLADDTKLDTLCQLHRILNISRAIVICNTDQRVSALMKNLEDLNFSVCAITDGMSTEEKDSVVKNFFSGGSNILITRNMVQNRILKQILVVINYDLPVNKTNYFNRVVEANRCDSTEIVINFASENEILLLQEIENYYGLEMVEISINKGAINMKSEQNDSMVDLKDEQNDVKTQIDNAVTQIKQFLKERSGQSNHKLRVPKEDSGNFVIQKFEDLNLREKLAQRLLIHGLIEPKPLQKQAVLPCVNGRDVIIQAPPGTGKKTIFSIAVLQNIDTSLKQCQVLVLVPTRQMAPKVLSVLTCLGTDLGIKCHVSVGGNSVADDIVQLKMGVHIVVGTVSRVCDLIRRNALRTEHIKTLVTVDANHLFSKTVVEQTCDIFKKLKSNTQIIVLSPNAPTKFLKESVKKFLKYSIYIVENYVESSLENMKQFYITVPRDALKLKILLKLYRKFAKESVVIFCNSKVNVVWVAKQMRNEGIEAFALHSDMDQKDINRITRNFCSVNHYKLVTTDMFLGAEVNGVSVVINYDLPFPKENYVRRLSICDCSCNKIIAITLVRDDEKHVIKKIKENYETKMKKMLVEV